MKAALVLFLLSASPVMAAQSCKNSETVIREFIAESRGHNIWMWLKSAKGGRFIMVYRAGEPTGLVHHFEADCLKDTRALSSDAITDKMSPQERRQFFPKLFKDL